ncbi:hypothetical protein SNK19_02510 [Ralstonia pseudosolanacearum]|uniref:hypothetical protein n=1 Tax=Ralstonia pseudosolanacearum TaxID=1310165 RepID=UPI003CE8C153
MSADPRNRLFAPAAPAVFRQGVGQQGQVFLAQSGHLRRRQDLIGDPRQRLQTGRLVGIFAQQVAQHDEWPQRRARKPRCLEQIVRSEISALAQLTPFRLTGLERGRLQCEEVVRQLPHILFGRRACRQENQRQTVTVALGQYVGASQIHTLVNGHLFAQPGIFRKLRQPADMLRALLLEFSAVQQRPLAFDQLFASRRERALSAMSRACRGNPPRLGVMAEWC